MTYLFICVIDWPVAQWFDIWGVTVAFADICTSFSKAYHDDAMTWTHFPRYYIRPWARGVRHAPPPPLPHISTKTIFFWTLRVARIRNEMLTVKILGLNNDLQLFSKGTLKTRIRNYCAAKILLWNLWPCNNAPYVLNDLNLVSNERWVFYLLYQHKIEEKWPTGVKLQPFQ